MSIKIAVLFGGRSVEHEVSVISALQAISYMDKSKYDIIPIYMTKSNEMYMGEAVGDIEAYKDIPGLISKSERVYFYNEGERVYIKGTKSGMFSKPVMRDVDLVFPIIHGTNVEDGALQGYLKTVGIPFCGSDVTASAISMDKYATKVILKENGIPVLDAKVFTQSDYANIEATMDDIEKIFGYPVIVKPINLGSSVGIGVANDRNSLEEAIDDAYRYASKILVEHAISNLREINCAVLGDENEAMPSECEEPMHTDEILSYEDKYVNNAKKTGSKGMASVSRQIPANISDKMRDEIRELSVKAFKVLGCNGVARLDFMIDADSDKVYFNEINPIPGSLSFYLWEPAGVPYSKLLDRIIDLALKRMRMEKELTFSFDTNILANAGIGGSKGVKK